MTSSVAAISQCIDTDYETLKGREHEFCLSRSRWVKLPRIADGFIDALFFENGSIYVDDDGRMLKPGLRSLVALNDL